jgi:hypothetical protein
MRDGKKIKIKVKRILFRDKKQRRAIVCCGINMSRGGSI